MVSDTSVTLEDETGPLTIKCSPLTIKKSLSDVAGSSLSCSSEFTSVRQNKSINWNLFGLNLDEFGPIAISWSGTGVSGMTTESVTNLLGYSTAGTANDVSVTLEDTTIEGPLTIKCNPVTITQITTGGGSGGGLVAPSCSNIANINNDSKCSVDILDFNILMFNWESVVSGNVADINNDGIVDVLDFNLLMLNWTGTL